MQVLKAIRKIRKSQPQAGGSSEGAGITPEVPDESTVIFTISSEETGEYVHEDEYMLDEVAEEMKDVGDDENRKDDYEVSNAAKADAEKTKEVKGDNKKVGLPPTSSSLYVSSGFGN
ncbi:hypothetical protein Tco_1204366 [Tanacetum coccineum]